MVFKSQTNLHLLNLYCDSDFNDEKFSDDYMLENMKVPYFLSLFAVQTWEPGHFKHGVGNKPTLPDHIGSKENDYGESLFKGSPPLPTHDHSDFGFIEDIQYLSLIHFDMK